MLKFMKRRWTILVPIAVAVAGGVFMLGYGWRDYSTDSALANCNYQFVNPLRCLQPALETEGGYARLETAIDQYLQQRRQSGDIARAGVHFRNLRNGATLGVNANEFFYPASLFKLPVAMAYYRLAENDPKILQQTLTTPATFVTPSQTIPVITEEIQPNQTYTVEDLIRRMLVYSDNRALEVLKKSLATEGQEDNLIGEILEDMGVLYQSKDGDLVVSARQYSSIMRILYNTNFLNQNSSEKILKILSETDFNDGLKKYLPADIQVAHKYGITRTSKDGAVQLADCGVVYYPEVNYTVCAMVEAKSYETGADVIANISKLVYEEINGRYK